MPIDISDVTRRVVYSGSAGVGPYSFSFEILNENDIAVYENDTLLTITTDYTVTINADGTGSVTLVSASSSSDTVAILGNKGIERLTDFVTGGDLFATSLNDEFDAQTIFAQQNAEAVSRAIKIPPQSSLSIDTTLPVPQGNYILGWNDTGDAILNLQEIGSYKGTDATTTTANYNNRDIVKDSSNSNLYICTAASTAGTLLTNTSYWALLVDAASASSAQTAAETAQSAAEDAQGYAEEWATKAEDSLISTDAGGDGSTDYSSLHHAAKASASASNAATSESNAEDWATKTDGIVDSTDYAAKAWSIGGTGVTDTASAGAAKEWATKAEDSTVDGTEYSAKHYAAKAAASASAAATSADNFDDRYLGPKASDPTLDNDGDALTTGDLYFNTSSNVMKVYNGSSWDQVAVSSTGLLTVANNLSDLNDAATARTNLGVQIGVDVQAYDADTLKADVADTITASMRGTVTTDNDLSFDMNATNNFSCTPTGTGPLTFTNITAGQSGNIYLDNSGGHVISAAATTFISAADLTKISTAGKYFVSYYSADGTNVLVSASSAVTASGA
jgi:hypothetical protein